VTATLGAPERRHQLSRRRTRNAQPQPEPEPVPTGRATIVDVGAPLPGTDAAERWLAAAGEPYLSEALAVLNRVLHAYRLVTADPFVNPVGVSNALVVRIGFGAGEQVADGLWTAARELISTRPRGRRAKILQPQARLAAVLTGRERPLVCEELTLRTRLDLDSGREREAALQLLVALDAAVAELPADPAAPALEDRVAELRSQRPMVGKAAQAALAGALADGDRQAVEFTLGRIEAALRARAVASA
jgi:hypothetical protein